VKAEGAQTRRIAFLGLGLMGTEMATRLLAAGNDVTVWNRTLQRAQALVEHGAKVADTPAEAVAEAEVAVTMLANPEALDAVLFGPEGASSTLRPGAILLEMSTVGPREVASVSTRLPAGVQVIDAPVRGSTGEARAGTLSIFVGAGEEAFEQVRDILEVLGTPQRVGGPGAGAAMKLVVNSTLGVAITAAGEALALGDALGLDRDRVLDVVEQSPVGAAICGKRDDIRSGSYPPQFKLRLALKDMGLAQDEAMRTGRELAVGAAARGWMRRAVDAGAGDMDIAAVVATIVAGPDAN
jgi:3-hydroxyisobutyrate dehydrogenase-like beta-hydroxyacid dehydrogenase